MSQNVKMMVEVSKHGKLIVTSILHHRWILQFTHENGYFGESVNDEKHKRTI